MGILSAYTLGTVAIGEWLGWWDKYKVVPGSAKDIARKELAALNEANRQKFWDVSKYKSAMSSEALAAEDVMEKEGLLKGSMYTGGVVEAADNKVRANCAYSGYTIHRSTTIYILGRNYFFP